MDGRHLRAEDRVGLAHLFGKGHLLDGRRADGPLCLFLFPYADRCEKRADTDAGSSQVIDLIDLQRGVDLVGIRQDLCHLVRGHGVQAASEGVELDQIQVLCCLHIVCRSVQAGVVHPLVHDVQRALHLMEVGHRILSQHGDIVGVDHLRQAVVHLGVNMVRTSRKDDPPVSCFV